MEKVKALLSLDFIVVVFLGNHYNNGGASLWGWLLLLMSFMGMTLVGCVISHLFQQMNQGARNMWTLLGRMLELLTFVVIFIHTAVDMV